ncbi:site-specific recombinase XerD [Halanaeroarchaeum sulfurireducens]|uniref:Site-specific recombinase XerD n=1 Tax=Halanaeroarchaeum sulfurireducens TaxID=1604004 RepID=A0A0F7PEL3_9EURY|nr:site-specific recombinase XerD [Halanaeroarchaeum sulfurireducens]ALG82158.1 site-specific recombinase XerD [Halanaeroarchaeum sulfurireducens]
MEQSIGWIFPEDMEPTKRVFALRPVVHLLLWIEVFLRGFRHYGNAIGEIHSNHPTSDFSPVRFVRTGMV